MSDRIEAEILDVLGEEVSAAVDTPIVVIEGTKGDPGADGITPTIGDNGNWYLGAADTGKPSRGKTGAQGAPGIYYGTTPPTGDTHPVWIDPNGDHDDGGLLPAVTDADNGKVLRVVNSAWSAEEMPTDGTDMGITGATVGQIAKITAVDTDGVPTAWAPVDMPEALPNPNALTFTGAVTGSYDGSAPLSVEIPSGGGSGSDISLGLTGATVGQIAKITAVDDTGKPTAWSPAYMPTGGSESTFEKVVEMTTLEDAAVISISTDKNGNPLSMSEFYVAITTARNSAATANGNFSCNVLPDTVPDYIRDTSAIKNVPLFQDVYCYVMHYKVVGGMIFAEFVGENRTAIGLNASTYLEDAKEIGINTTNGLTVGWLSPPVASNGVSKIDSAGKMYCITFGANSTACIFGAGTRVEVWAR